MKFILAHVDYTTDSESDYETAVDMSHWSMSETTYTLQHESGASLTLSERDESYSYTYMEPDFDHLEDTGNIVYLTHSDTEKNQKSDNHNTQYHSYFNVPFKAPKMSEKDIENYHHSQNENLKYSDLTEAQWQTVNDYISFKAGEKDMSSYDLNTSEIKEIISCINSSGAKKGYSIDFKLSESTMDTLNNVINETYKINDCNMDTRIHNQCAEASFNINKKLTEMFDQLKEELVEDWQHKKEERLEVQVIEDETEEVKTIEKKLRKLGW